LGIWEAEITTEGGLTSSQLEIARALRTAYEAAELRRIGRRLGSLYDEMACIQPRVNKLAESIDELLEQGRKRLHDAEQKRFSALFTGPLSHDQQMEKNRLLRKAVDSLPSLERNAYDRMDLERLQREARIQTIQTESVPLIRKMQFLGINSADLSSGNLLQLKSAALQGPALSAATPRVAAADQMLKEMIIAIEDDLDRIFVQPMIRGLRERLTTETKVRVGILQRESLLATNRGKARVDPRASAQLAVGEETDILTGVQQLAQLYGAVQSGGALAALGALQQQPREQPPEIIALTTGNRFEVTPIFDPSGQALRFKFDFVSASKLQEPNGSTDPQFPRIERHTVNTEVQLSNLETREISRFESNARLGRPTQYWGGFPVFKDIPYVRPWVPLVGWFVRKGGSNAVAQQSVIFGQTTIYPTIGALVDLLSRNGLETEPATSTTSCGSNP
jgi:hypothetical protein